MSTPFLIEGAMTRKQQYEELLRLKDEIGQRMGAGTGFQGMRELMLYLAQDKSYSKLKFGENQLIMLESFLNIWLKEKKKLPDLGVETDIFYKISCLDDVEQKYQRIKFCGMRIENAVPDEYIEQALQWLTEDKVSGLAAGKVIAYETKNREENLLCLARRLRERGDSLNALLILQFANEAFPGQEKLLLEEADIWLSGREFDKALELLTKIAKPSQGTKELMAELRQVVGDG